MRLSSPFPPPACFRPYFGFSPLRHREPVISMELHSHGLSRLKPASGIPREDRGWRAPSTLLISGSATFFEMAPEVLAPTGFCSPGPRRFSTSLSGLKHGNGGSPPFPSSSRSAPWFSLLQAMSPSSALAKSPDCNHPVLSSGVWPSRSFRLHSALLITPALHGRMILMGFI